MFVISGKQQQSNKTTELYLSHNHMLCECIFILVCTFVDVIKRCLLLFFCNYLTTLIKLFLYLNTRHYLDFL